MKTVTNAQLDVLDRKLQELQGPAAVPPSPAFALLIEIVDLLKELNERLSTIELQLP